MTPEAKPRTYHNCKQELDAEIAAHRQTQEELAKSEEGKRKLQSQRDSLRQRNNQHLTSSDLNVLAERDSLQTQLEEARQLLNQAGGLARLVSQTGGIGWYHEDGSRVTVEGVDELVERIQAVLAARGTDSGALSAKPELVDTEHGMTTGELADLWPKIAKPEAVSTQGDEGRSQLRELQDQKEIIGAAIYEIHSILVTEPLQADDARTFSEALHELRVAAEVAIEVRSQLERTQEVNGKLVRVLEMCLPWIPASEGLEIAKSVLAEAAK